MAIYRYSAYPYVFYTIYNEASIMMLSFIHSDRLYVVDLDFSDNGKHNSNRGDLNLKQASQQGVPV